MDNGKYPQRFCVQKSHHTFYAPLDSLVLSAAIFRVSQVAILGPQNMPNDKARRIKPSIMTVIFGDML